LTFQKIEVEPEFPQHRLRLMFDFLKQHFLRAHGARLNRRPRPRNHEPAAATGGVLCGPHQHAHRNPESFRRHVMEKLG
jgi:hypothetical protein